MCWCGFPCHVRRTTANLLPPACGSKTCVAYRTRCGRRVEGRTDAVRAKGKKGIPPQSIPPLPPPSLSCHLSLSYASLAPILLSSTPVPIPPAAGSLLLPPPLPPPHPPFCMCGVLLVMLPTVPANSTISVLLLLLVVVVVFLVVELGCSGLLLSSWRLSSTTEVTPVCSLLMR